MATIFAPPTVNDQGNINVHRNEGCRIHIGIQNDEGEEVDASDLPLFFISGSFRKALDPNPSDEEGRLLILSPVNLQDIAHGAEFRVVDETNPAMPILHWEGKIFKRG